MLAAALRVIRADLRSRPLHTALTGLVVAFALGALVVTLHGRATLDDPYDRLFRATNGAHVTAVSDSRADLDPHRRAARRGRRRGPAPARRACRARFGGQGDTIGLIGLPRTRARVERPLILEGRAALGPGELVLQRDYAREHGLALGDDDRGRQRHGAARPARRRHRRHRRLDRRRLGRPGRRARARHRAAARCSSAIGAAAPRPGRRDGVRAARGALGARGLRPDARLAHPARRAAPTTRAAC